MHAHNFTFDDGDEAQVIEHLHAVFPGIAVAVLALAFFVEAVYGADLTRLMIAS